MVRDGLLNTSDQEKNMETDCLAHVFWEVLDDSCRYLSNPLFPEAAQAIYIDPKSVRLPGTRLGHMSGKLARNKPLMNMSVPRQWLGREATAAAGYEPGGPIRKYQGGWQPHVGYPPYVPKKKAEYGHHLVIMPKNEAPG